MSSFSLVVISYNGREFLRKCLKNIEKSVIKPHKIVVVDDFSNDGTEEMVKNEFSFVEFIRNDKNLGPTVSRNKGAKLVGDEYIIFLDNDVLVEPETFKKMVDFMENKTEAGIVGVKIVPEGKEKMEWNIGYDPNNFREAIGYFIGFLLKIFPQSQWLKNFSMKFILNYWNYDKLLEVGWVIESCFIIRKEIFNKLEGFDERFFMYYEGPDLCLRIRQRGYKVYFYPEVRVDVLEGHAHSKLKRSLFLLKTKYLFYQKHYFYKKSNPILFGLGKIISGILYLIG
jgi:hypothetical protein